MSRWLTTAGKATASKATPLPQQSGTPRHSSTRPARRQRGAAMIEFVVVLPALLLLGLGSLQSALFYQAKTTATFEAARKRDEAGQSGLNSHADYSEQVRIIPARL